MNVSIAQIRVKHPTLKGRFSFKFSAQERKVFQRKKRIIPSEWSAKNMIIPTGKYEHGLVNMDITPHLAGMLDAAAQPYVRECNVCAPSQTSKTTFAFTFLAWASVYLPGPTLSVFPVEPLATENMVERIQIAYNKSPTLASLKTGRKDDESKHHLRLINMFHRLAWYGSISSMQNRTIKYCYEDEIDLSGGRYVEADKRVRTVSDHKILRTSATILENGGIWTILEKETSAVYVRWARCPCCMHLQYMVDKRIKFDKEVGRLRIKDEKLARYDCSNPDCNALWTDQDRDRAMQLGEWRHFAGDKLSDFKQYQEPGEPIRIHMLKNRPVSIGFILHSWQSHFVSLSEVAHDLLKSTDKELAPEDRLIHYKDYCKNHRSFPFRYLVQAKPVNDILKLRDERPAWLVPGNGVVAGVYAGIDTHDNGFYVTIWAIGYGFKRDVWLIGYRFVDSFAAIAEMLFETAYEDNDGNRYMVELAAQDMLGHRTSEVKDFCVEYDGLIIPAFGVQEIKSGEAYTLHQQEYVSGTGQRYPGGLKTMRVNTKFFKDRFSAKLAVAPLDPGSIRLHSEADKNFCGQLIAEARNEKNIWELISGRANHYGDASLLAFIAAEHAGVQFRQPPLNEGNYDDDDMVETIVVESSFMGR